MNEFIYIASNEFMPGLIKVGKTTTNPPRRLRDLETTGVPGRFELELSLIVSNCEQSEKDAHRVLKSYRVSVKREFFKISVKDAIELVLSNIKDYKIDKYKETHDIEVLVREVDRRVQEKKAAERDRLIARRREAEKRIAETLACRRKVEQKVDDKEQELSDKGPRPARKDYVGIGWLLILCYWPIPIGWAVWLGALRIFEANNRTIGWMCILLIVSGYIVNATYKKDRAEYEAVYLPFRKIDDELYRLRQDLQKIDNELYRLRQDLDGLPKE